MITTTSTTGGSSLVRLPASRLRRAGPPGATAADWAARVALVLLVAAAAWLAYVLLRPLPVAQPPAALRVPVIPAFPEGAQPTERRRAQLASLSASNLFDAEREPWAARAAAAADADQPAANTPDDARSNRRRGNASGAAPANRPSRNPLAAADALPEDVKQALTGLALRAVFMNTKGQPVALISRVFAGPNPFLADPFQPGDEFEDKQFPQAKWLVEEIDVPARRVFLSRNGTTTSLDMYPVVAGPKQSGTVPASSAGPAQPEVIARSPNEARADLISAGLSEAEADRLLQLAAMNESDAQTQAKLDALINQSEASAGSDQPKKRRGPPPGMENIIKMMRESAKPQSDSLPPPQSPPSEPSSSDQQSSAPAEEAPVSPK